MTAVEAWAPLYRTAPAWPDTDGDLAARLAADMGWALDDVQQFLVDAALADDHGLPACSSVAVVGPRQTVGKTVALQVAALFDVFIGDVGLHVWTAHRYSTAEKTFEDLRKRILAHRDYARRTTFTTRTGQQSIIVDGGGTLEFHARSGKTGRGFPGVSRLTLDEWLYGRPGDIGALAPTGVTRPDFQIRYASSAGMPESGELRRLRTRGRVGVGGLAYVELGAPVTACAADGAEPPPRFSGSRCRHDLTDTGCALNDRRLWWAANSGLWAGRIREVDVAKQREELPATEFAREFLSWWDDPPGEGSGALDAGRFGALAAPGAVRGRPVWWGAAVAPDRSWAALAVAWRRAGGGVHVMVSDYRPHASWLADRIAEVRYRWGGVVVVDSRARTVWPDSDRPAWLREPGETDQALAEATLSDAVTAGTVTHGNEPELLAAVGGAVWAVSGAHRRLVSGTGLDVSPLRAAALAVHAASASADPLSQVW